MNNLPTGIEYKKGIRLEKTAIKIINDVLGGDTTEELMGNFKMIKDKIRKEYNKKDTKKGKRGDDITRLIELILKTNEKREAKYIIENELTGKDDEEKLHDFAEKIKHGKFKNRYPQKIWNNILSIIKNTLKTNEEQVIEQIINELNGTNPTRKIRGSYKKIGKG